MVLFERYKVLRVFQYPIFDFWNALMENFLFLKLFCKLTDLLLWTGLFGVVFGLMCLESYFFGAVMSLLFLKLNGLRLGRLRSLG